MGGILGNEAWRRSNGGLWLPRAFGMPETVYGWCPCGETVCECACENCAAVNGEHVNNAPCCWRVEISGITATDPEDCEDCSRLNGVYFLRQDRGENADPCTWKADACYCDIDVITLSVTESDGIYAITVTLGQNSWSKTFGQPPDCCANEEVLAYTASGSGCDASGATCKVSPVIGDDQGLCPTVCHTCEGCVGNRRTRHLQIDLSAVASNSGLAFCKDGCSTCEDLLNGTFILTAKPTLIIGSYPMYWMCPWDGYISNGFTCVRSLGGQCWYCKPWTISASVSCKTQSPDEYVLEVRAIQLGESMCNPESAIFELRQSEPFDCVNLDVDVPLVSATHNNCYFESAVCHVTAL